MERRESNGERPPPDSVLDRERERQATRKDSKNTAKIYIHVYTSVVVCI